MWNAAKIFGVRQNLTLRSARRREDILVSERAAVPTGLGDDADRAGALDPLLGCHGEAVQTSLHFKPVEFDGFKGRVTGRIS